MPEVVLRAPGPADFQSLSRWRTDAETQRLLMSRGTGETAEQVEQWIARRTNDPDGAFFVIAGDDDRAVGFAQLTQLHHKDRHAHLGLCVDERVRGQGVAARALALLETRARDEYQLRKLLLEVLESNERARRFYERSGYLNVGVLRAHHAEGGVFHDVRVMEKPL